MQLHQPVFKERAYPLYLLLLLLAAFGAWMAWAGKYESFRQLTGFHSSAADFFFRNVTHFGDGIFILALAAVVSFRKKFFLAAGIVGGYLLSGLLAQAGKRMLDMPRPKAWFEALGESVYEVPGLEVHLRGSFPSGHTASVFALSVFLLLALPYRWYSWLLLLMAFVVGYSRVYLSQHFPVDVWAGAIIGSFSGCLVYVIIRNSKYSNTKFQNITKL